MEKLVRKQFKKTIKKKYPNFCCLQEKKMENQIGQRLKLKGWKAILQVNNSFERLNNNTQVRNLSQS